MPGKKKGGLALILGLHPKEEGEERDEEMDDQEIQQARHDAAQELIEAVHAKDADRLLEAMKTLEDLPCESEPASSGEDEPDDEEAT